MFNTQELINIIQDNLYLAYLIIFVFSLLENSIYFGFIVPGTVLLVAAGAIAQQGTLSLPICFVLAFTGTALGDSGSYWITRYAGAKILRRAKVQKAVHTYGMSISQSAGRFIVLAHLSPYLRSLIPTLAGLVRIPYRIWVFFDVIGAFLSCSAFLILGWVGASIAQVQHSFRWVGLAIFAIFILFGIQFGFRRLGKGGAPQ